MRAWRPQTSKRRRVRRPTVPRLRQEAEGDRRRGRRTTGWPRDREALDGVLGVLQEEGHRLVLHAEDGVE